MRAKQMDMPWYVNGDAWVLTQNEWQPDRNLYFETIFTQSNGYMGVRGYTEETNTGMKTVRERYLAGVFGHMDDEGQKLLAIKYPWPSVQMLTLPELFGCTITLGGEVFTMTEGRLGFFRRTLNMRNGVLSRHLVWESPQGRRTRLQLDRFLSAAVPHLAMQQITLIAENWSDEATLRFGLNGTTPSFFRCGDRALPHPPQHLYQHPRVDDGRYGAPVLTAEMRGTGHTVSLASALSGDGRHALLTGPADLNQEVTLTLTLTLATGKPAMVTHAVAVVSSRDQVAAAEVPRRAAELAAAANSEGYDASLAASESVWEQRWHMSDITIDGPGRDQAYIRFGAFSMLQMAPFHTDRMSIPARAYAYNRYHGHYYWDSETFLMPYYLHTHPEVAEHLLRFRHRTLDGARRTAQRLKSAGACYPWMADSDDGTEQAPWGIGDYVWHQNADIAYALDQYVTATGHTAFMADYGLEMLVETARFWMSRIEEDASGVMHLHDTVGPDELDKHGKDNGYTSLMARRNFRLAVKWLEAMRSAYPDKTKTLTEKLEVTASEVAAWSRTAERLAVPQVPGRSIPLQDEFLLSKKPLSFEGLTADEAFAMRHTHQVVKQADIIVAMFRLQDEFTIEQMREAYDFYEPMTLHYSSLSYNTHAIIATKIGRPEQAYDYFMKAAGLDLDNLRDATKDGLHAAALAGTWQTLVFGFLNLRIEGDALMLAPRLPEAWKSIKLRLVFRGYRLTLRIDHYGQVIEVDDADGLAPAHITIHGDTHLLRAGQTLDVSNHAIH